jgi:phage terminase large subunit
MFIELENGSTWQVVGSDNFDALVGSPPVGIVFSEWALAKPEAWTYLRPILAENGGWAIFIWTSRGRNHAVRAFEARERDKANWFTQRSTALETGVFSVEQLDRERQELIDEAGSEEEGDAKFRQEYLVDFDAAVPGSYFGAQIKKATDEGRIGAFGTSPRLKVDTAWDIGVDDYTAIWFFQDNGKRVRVIDYVETSGEGPDTIVPNYLPELNPDREAGLAQLAELGRAAYEYRTHFLPHDVMVREWGAGAKSRFQSLVALGVKPIRVGVAAEPRRADQRRPPADARRLLRTPSAAPRASTGCATTASAGTRRPACSASRCTTRTATAPIPLANTRSTAGSHRSQAASEPPRDRWDGTTTGRTAEWKAA